MKILSLSFTVLLTFICFENSAQNFEGTWTGGIQGLPLIFQIDKTESGYTAKMQSPKQSKQFLPMTSVRVQSDSLIMKLDAYTIEYKGQLVGETISGIFTQGGMRFSMELSRKPFDPSSMKRPQDPEPPYAYQVEEVSFLNKDANNIKLAGTLTLPPGIKNPPVAVLISGSGPQNRNEELLNHRPFLVLADHLTKNGIAVLRYDDRGVGESEGNYATATSEDLATDAAAAVAYLKSRSDVDGNKIGLIGHSEGGLIAPMVIADYQDDVAFFISLAGPGVSGKEVLLPQLKKIAILNGASEELANYENQMFKTVFEKINNHPKLSQAEMSKEIEEIISDFVANGSEDFKKGYNQETQQSIAQQFSQDWMRFFITHDPTNDLQKVDVPTLLLNGSLDYQIIPELNLPEMEKKIKSNGNEDVTVIEFDGMNHLFQNATTGAGYEYEMIDETIAPKVLSTISEWINERF
ncbi:hypothetical protein BST97_12645 [Nonlabens spongiae]|uniref:Serine aminopeptidase S33 domain-containing protein n=1 Tax=Nonlabens spongiae TaxID=331648 RepID=A0A1W6MME5_9FLAO|nr:alpha/beta fold hydrolase [Nonlabens spongiae]ARN78773.1 hypothetical protein BST97_12645 [Nonlabens spongiae]